MTFQTGGAVKGEAVKIPAPECRGHEGPELKLVSQALGLEGVSIRSDRVSI